MTMSSATSRANASTAGFWPTSAQYSEAVQNLHSSMRDEELRGGNVTMTPWGVPAVWSGSFAYVYRVVCPATKTTWAVRFFQSEVAGLQNRYDKISRHLARVRLPFLSEFAYLPDGVRIDGQTFPLVKMRWVEGKNLNEFVRESLDQPAVLQELGALWVKMAERLEGAEIAHGDLQHGNVLLVRGEDGRLRLRPIDYDGMFVPDLSGEPAWECGLAAYQHPRRKETGAFGLAIDRFSHLAVCCALRCLREGGRGMWERHDTGENLLFRESDYMAPGASPLFRELWMQRHPDVRALVGHLALAALRPLDETPRISDVIKNGRTLALTPEQQRQVEKLFQPAADASRPGERERRDEAVEVLPAPDANSSKEDAVFSWPTSAQYSEAVQNLASSVTDLELRAGQVKRHPTGMPWLYAGGFADVYPVYCPATGATWAVKCFKRQTTGLRERYGAISRHLAEHPLPFMVDFAFLNEGIRIRGENYPLVKMQWIEGRNLAQFVGDFADQPGVLEKLFALWVKLAHRLADARIAHGDLQHGNILLVPHDDQGCLQLRLVDYDGMYVPKLAGKPAGEAGLANFQHPERLHRPSYGLEVDRFSHLVILTGIRAVRAGGRAFWERFQFDDGLLFHGEDFLDPAKSSLFQTLLESPDEIVRRLAARLALACRRAMVQTPPLKAVLEDTTARPLSSAEQVELRDFLAGKLARSWKPPDSTGTEHAAADELLTPRTEPGPSSFPAPAHTISTSLVSVSPTSSRLDESGPNVAPPAVAKRRRKSASPWQVALPWLTVSVGIGAAVVALAAAILREPAVEPLAPPPDVSALVPPPGSPIAPPSTAAASARLRTNEPPIGLSAPATILSTGEVPEPNSNASVTRPDDVSPSAVDDVPPDDAGAASTRDESPDGHLFAGWRRQISLPTADDIGWDIPFVFGASPALDRGKLRVELLGGDVASRSVGRFLVTEPKNADADSPWRIQVTDSKVVRPIATIHLRDERLVFQWTVAVDEARRLGALCNCVLRLRQGGAVHAVALRIPRTIPALRVTLSKASEGSAHVPYLPDEEHLIVEAHLESALLNPSDAKSRPSEQDGRRRLYLKTLPVGREDLDYFDPPLQIKLELSLTANLRVLANLQVRSPERNEWGRFNKDTLEKALGLEKYERVFRGSVMDPMVRAAYGEIYELRNARSELGVVHVRGYCKADDVTVELFQTH